MATKKLYDISKDEQIILAFQNIKPKPKTQLTAEELITKYRTFIVVDFVNIVADFVNTRINLF